MPSSPPRLRPPLYHRPADPANFEPGRGGPEASENTAEDIRPATVRGSHPEPVRHPRLHLHRRKARHQRPHRNPRRPRRQPMDATHPHPAVSPRRNDHTATPPRHANHTPLGPECLPAGPPRRTRQRPYPGPQCPRLSDDHDSLSKIHDLRSRGPPALPRHARPPPYLAPAGPARSAGRPWPRTVVTPHHDPG